MDRTLEVVLLPVRDVDRAVEFCRDQVGSRLDHRTTTEQMDIAQPTPSGSGCSIVVGDLPGRPRRPAAGRGARAQSRGRCSGRRPRVRAASAMSSTSPAVSRS